MIPPPAPPAPPAPTIPTLEEEDRGGSGVAERKRHLFRSNFYLGLLPSVGSWPVNIFFYY